MPATIQCAQCGLMFKGRSGRQAVFCSRRCFSTSRRVHTEIPCPECGTLFTPKSFGGGVTRTCSMRCGGWSRSDKWRSCLRCGARFRWARNGRGIPTKFCSRDCFTAAARDAKLSDEERRSRKRAYMVGKNLWIAGESVYLSQLPPEWRPVALAIKEARREIKSRGKQA